MTDNESDQQDAEVVQLAVDALSAAQRRALDSGRPVVLVVKGDLVRVEPGGSFLLKQLPPRRQVFSRNKQASQ